MSSPPRSIPRKELYPRVTSIGFNVKIDLAINIKEPRTSENIAKYLTNLIRETMPGWCTKGIKNISYLASDSVTSVCVASEQNYFNKLGAICKEIFSGMSAEIGEEAIVAMDIEMSKKIVGIFKQYERSNPSFIHKFRLDIVENPVIRQPSPLPGMIPPSMMIPSIQASPSAGSYLNLAPITNALDSSNFRPIADFAPLPAIQTTPSTPGSRTPTTTDCAAPRKRQADEERTPRPAKASKCLEYESPKEPQKNPWDLKPNHLEELKSFLKNPKPWNQPTKFRDMRPDEKPANYYNKKKSAENQHPAIAIAMTNLVPSIARRAECQSSILTVDIAEDHRVNIRKLVGYFHCNETEGIYTLLQWTNMNSLYYGLKASAPFKKSFNAIEIHRRIMAIEGAVVEIANYLEEAICEGHSTLRSMAPIDLTSAYTVLEANNSANPGTKTPAMEHILKIVPLAEFSRFETTLSELVFQLKVSRAQALTRNCPFLTELGWGVGLLAMLYSLLGPLKRLDDEVEANNVLVTVMACIDRRTSAYIKDLEPALLYGSRLTTYTIFIRELCNKFNFLKPTPANLAGKFHEIDSSGRILKADGIPASLGMLKPPTGRENWLLPMPTEFWAVVPDSGAEAICQSMINDEQRLINDMLSDLGISDSPLIAHANAGNARVKALLQADLPGLNLTSVLPPSASLPTAWFEPEVVFALGESPPDSMKE